MKKQILRLIAFVMLVGTISSCSIEYREHHGHMDHGHDHEHHDHY